ncbi:hypothetical protein QJS10_CPB04g01829 [Acorus calamus]|uniref:Uncharacterized protein n=1 Tax=Acorus calamus TaxID=4465 RepID=A0AAV9F2E4_ACOCL|nr:hypothetical protein QJS10_CPB04g01829 [Acorus calamus]
MDIEMICQREEINEKNNIIAQQVVLIDHLQSQKPIEESNPLQLSRSMIKRIKLKGQKGTRDPDFEYTHAEKKGKRKAIEAPSEKNKKSKFSFKLPKNAVTNTLAQKHIKQLRHVVGITSGSLHHSPHRDNIHHGSATYFQLAVEDHEKWWSVPSITPD